MWRFHCCWFMDIQFPSCMATFLSWRAAGSHLVSVKLTPYCRRSSMSSLNCTLLYVSSRSIAVASLFLPLESFVNIICESGCMFFAALCLPWFGRSSFLLSRSWASFLATICSISFPVVFCIVRIWYPFSLLWSLPSLGIGLR